MANHAETTLAHAAYGRFSRRLRAFVIDWIIIVLLLTAALFLAISANSDQIGRVVGLTFAAVWFLYDPLLVSLTGSTVGHYLTNLRVVDDSTHGNLGFMKAVARHLIKYLLGIYSFVTMATTSRHQAVHDLLTRSTVQVRDRSKAGADDYVAERIELLSPSMPSRIRRIAFILGYIVLLFLLYVLALGQLMSGSCISSGDRCSSLESTTEVVLSLIFLGASALFVILGWRGRLYGCRTRTLKA